MTSFIYLGADVPSNRTILEAQGVKNVGVSFWRLYKRGLPKTKQYLLANYFPEFMSIHAHAGVPRNMELSQADLEEFAAMYEDFIAHNIDRLTTFTELDHPRLSQDFVNHQRKAVWSQVSEGKFRPVWNSVTGIQGLESLAATYLDIGISGEDIEGETNLASVTSKLHRQWGTRFHALGCAKPDNLRQNKFETASTMAWLSPMLNGETIVWDGTKIKRYPKNMKDQARSRYRTVYEKAGLNEDKILEDDNREISRLALWSFDQLEQRMNMGTQDNGDYAELYDNSEGWLTPDTTEHTPAVPDRKAPEVRKIERRNEEEMTQLPVLGYTQKQIVDPLGTITDVTLTSSNSVPIRNCDTCFVASNCPAFKPQTTCAFNLPVEVRTPEQLEAFLNSIIEMQGQRVLFMRFVEELNGGYADPNVSQEIDRFVKLVKTTSELGGSSDKLSISLERKTSAGVMTRLFGNKAEILNEDTSNGFNYDQTTRIIQQAIED